MKNCIIKPLCAVIAALLAASLTACNSVKTSETASESLTDSAEKTISVTENKTSSITSKINSSTESTEKSEAEISTKKQESTRPTETNPQSTTIRNTVTVATSSAAVPSTKGEEISEIYNGISLLTKTSPVSRGNYATIMIQGVPEKQYTIEFYETPSKKAESKDLSAKTADANGFVSWTFPINNSCEKGNRKIIIREKGSSNLIQTSIVIV